MDGSSAAPLPFAAQSRGNTGLNPVYSPDGKHILFISLTSDKTGQNTRADVSVMNADGKAARQLTTTGKLWSANWRADGRKIVYDSDHRIWTMNADGSNKVQLTGDTFSDSLPVFSPDGTQIAFASNRAVSGGTSTNNDTFLYVMNADGSNQHPIMLADPLAHYLFSIDWR